MGDCGAVFGMVSPLLAPFILKIEWSQRVKLFQWLGCHPVVQTGGTMVLSMTQPFKHPKTGIYDYRKVVPELLRAVIGKREEKRSLKTKDPQIATPHFSSC